MPHGKRFFFVGIGGSGMMPLAMILAGRGATVEGSDRGLDAGARAGEVRRAAKRSASRCTRRTAAASTSRRPDRRRLRRGRGQRAPTSSRPTGVGAPRMSRAELQAALFNDAALSIGVAGTSGKSTVTGMIGWILHARRPRPDGDERRGDEELRAPDAPVRQRAGRRRRRAFVSEVDESDGSIALYRPQIAVLNNVSLDHKALDELRAAVRRLRGARPRTTVVNVGDPEAAALATALDRARMMTVAVEGAADLCAQNLMPGAVRDRLRPGAHGGRAPAACGWRCPARTMSPTRWPRSARRSRRACRSPRRPRAIEGFTGLRRRFELVGEAAGVAVIDDFGHNPDKIAATLATLHAFPGRLLLLFQPHGYGPLKVDAPRTGRDLREELGRRTTCWCCPIRSIRAAPSTREVTSADIVADVRAGGRERAHIPDRAAAAAHLVAQRPARRPHRRDGRARRQPLSLLAADMLGAARRR